VTTTPAERVAAESFEALYDSARGDLYRALATITDDRDLSTEAVDVGFTRWRRKVRKPTHVPPDVGVMAAAFKWAQKQAGKKSGQLSGFRLSRDSDVADQTVLGRFHQLSFDERGMLVMQHVLGWTDVDISHAVGAQGVGMAATALNERLGGEGFGPDRVSEALRNHAASFTIPLSRLDAVKTKGTMQRVGAFAGGAVLTAAAVAGATVLAGNIGGSEPEAPVAGTAISSTAPTGKLTAENAVWQRVPAPVNNDQIQALTHDGTDFYLLASDDRGRPVMMRSDNGLDWIQVPGPVVGQNMWFQQLVATPDILLAVGNGFDEIRGNESTVVFTSTDHETWTRVDLPIEDEVQIGDQVVSLYTWVERVDVTDTGFTIVGNQGAEFDPEQLLRDVVDAALLRNGYGTGPDGMEFFDNQGRVIESMTWEELGLDPEFASILNGNRPVHWTSTDGLEWEAVSVTTPPGSQGIGSFVTTGEVEAVLSWGDFGPSVWIKSDDEWVRPDIDASVSAMTSWDGQLLVAGTTTSGDANIWSTTDGKTWEQREIPVGGIQQFFTSSSGIVGLGYGEAFANTLGPAEIEVGDLTVLASSNGRFEVLDADGNTLAEASEEDVAGGDMMTITDPESGEVVVEFERVAFDEAWQMLYREADFRNQGPPQVSILMSQDGVTWTVIETSDPDFYPNSVAFGNDALLVIGWSDSGGFLGFGGGGQQLLLATPAE